MAVRHRSVLSNGSTRNQIGLFVRTQLVVILHLHRCSGFGEYTTGGGRRAYLVPYREALHRALLQASISRAQWKIPARNRRYLLCARMAGPVDLLEGQYHRGSRPIRHAFSPDPKQGSRTVFGAKLAAFLR